MSKPKVKDAPYFAGTADEDGDLYLVLNLSACFKRLNFWYRLKIAYGILTGIGTAVAYDLPTAEDIVGDLENAIEALEDRLPNKKDADPEKRTIN